VPVKEQIVSGGQKPRSEAINFTYTPSLTDCTEVQINETITGAGANLLG